LVPLSEIFEHPLWGFINNPLGSTFRSMAIDGNLLRVVRNRNMSSVPLEAVTAAPIVRRGLLGTTLTVPVGGSADLVLRGASFRDARRFAEQLQSTWVEFNLSALEREGPLVDHLCDGLNELMHRPSRYPAASAVAPLLTDIRALNDSVLSKLQPTAIGADAAARIEQEHLVGISILNSRSPTILSCRPSESCIRLMPSSSTSYTVTEAPPDAVAS
jgi:DNA helicase-4